MRTEPIKSPTCADCALRAGLVPANDCHTVSRGTCANCYETKAVSATKNWKWPEEID